MTRSKLPARPSLESLRKQAKKLERSIAAGDAEGWAAVAAKDEKLARFLHEAQQRREQARAESGSGDQPCTN